MPLRSFAAIDRAVRAGWSHDTCDPVDLPDWSPANPARGQCGVTALVLWELVGGDLLLAPVDRADGSRQGVHYWNRLAAGVEVDLTREQFTAGERVGEPAVVAVPPGPPSRLAAQHALLRRRVRESLGLAG
jgi:hypothetical protein